MNVDLVRVDLAAPFVAVVTLDRPPVNALGRAIREKFLAAMDELQERADVRVIVLTGAGRVFSAGADIKEKNSPTTTAHERRAAERLTRDSFLALLDSTKPVIAAVNGAALGAGLVMVACCDIVLAAESALVAMPEVDVGLGGGASLLQRLMPAPLIRRLVLTGERMPAAELIRVGTIAGCVPDDQLLAQAVELASGIARKSPRAVQTIRGSFGAVWGLGPREGFQLEQAYTRDLSSSADAQEARRAFLEKRAPRF